MGDLFYIELRLINVKYLTLLCIKHVIERLLNRALAICCTSIQTFLIATLWLKPVRIVSLDPVGHHMQIKWHVSLLFTTSERNLAFGMERWTFLLCLQRLANPDEWTKGCSWKYSPSFQSNRRTDIVRWVISPDIRMFLLIRGKKIHCRTADGQVLFYIALEIGLPK